MNTQQFFDNKTLGCGHRVKVRYGDSNDFNGNGYIVEISPNTEFCSVKLDENPNNWGIDGVITLTFQPHRVQPQDKITMSSPNAEDLLEMEDEMEFCNYGEKDGIIQVAGGGMMNGNAYADIEGEWETIDEYNDGADGEIYYCEYGNNPCRRLIGEGIEWGDDDNFNVI